MLAEIWLARFEAEVRSEVGCIEDWFGPYQSEEPVRLGGNRLRFDDEHFDRSDLEGVDRRDVRVAKSGDRITALLKNGEHDEEGRRPDPKNGANRPTHAVAGGRSNPQSRAASLIETTCRSRSIRVWFGVP